MRNQMTLVDSSHGSEHYGGEMRRRITDCRERLRRNRAARRISGHVTPHTDDFSAEALETALASVAADVRGEKT
ncbi:MAG: hypothetical protein H7Z38_18650 [Rubrivivax sp.]|nr:hypothetical protein [Pyrinomonadaceae bacterium]